VEFINSNEKQQFRLIEKGDAKLYIYGYTNLDDKCILSTLIKKKFPEKIRGQFAFVYINGDDWIGCVDHYCSTNLYYNDKVISPLYRSVMEITPRKTIDRIFQQQMEILKTHTVGPFTKYNEIKSIEAEHYVKGDKSYRYSDILNEPMQKFDSEKGFELFVNASKKVDLSKSAICLSGGKDSAWVAMLMHELGYNPRLVHITSDRNTHSIDDQQCKLYKRELGWPVNHYEIEYTGMIVGEDDIFYELWNDSTFPVKRHSVKNHPGYKITGEVGCPGQQAHKFGTYLANNRDNIHDDDIINLYLHIHHIYGKKHNLVPTTREMWGEDLMKGVGFEYIFEYFRDAIKRTDKPDAYKYFNFQFPSFAIHRLWPQTQDTMNTWFNFYSDYDVSNYLLNIPWEAKYAADGTKKFCLYEIGRKHFKNWSDISWRFPAEGMGIPAKEKYSV